MKFAFGIVSVFPGGGLQRDCVEIARKLQKLGHAVTLFTSRKSDDEFAAGLPLRVLNTDASTNHSRQRSFSEEFAKSAVGNFDLLVGFDKLGSLDVLYCSDRSMGARAAKNPLLQLMPRYRQYIDLERRCFAPGMETEILLLSEAQRNEYWGVWTTEQSRLLVLSPTLSTARRKPECRTDGTRGRLRESLGLSEKDWVWLAIGVQPKTKGLDRTLRALQQMPDAHLLICGLRKLEPRSESIFHFAQRLGVDARIDWLGHREDIAELMAAADLFVHPARYDTTGTVILESIVNGLPVVTTAACGYSTHVSSASAGIVIPSPFRQRAFIAALETAHDTGLTRTWSKSGAEYGAHNCLYEGRDQAAELIVARAESRSR
jgi:UDP-glucose:(heptosyl)LPS alpha-1,3-glucosyltransferase